MFPSARMSPVPSITSRYDEDRGRMGMGESLNSYSDEEESGGSIGQSQPSPYSSSNSTQDLSSLSNLSQTQATQEDTESPNSPDGVIKKYGGMILQIAKESSSNFPYAATQAEAAKTAIAQYIAAVVKGMPKGEESPNSLGDMGGMGGDMGGMNGGGLAPSPSSSTSPLPSY